MTSLLLAVALSGIGQRLADLKANRPLPLSVATIRQGVSPVKAESKMLTIVPKILLAVDNSNPFPMCYWIMSSPSLNGPWDYCTSDGVAANSSTTNALPMTNGFRFFKLKHIAP